MSKLETYTLYNELRREGVPLRGSVDLGDGIAMALWERDETAFTEYLNPTHHTLSMYVEGGHQFRRRVGKDVISKRGAGDLCVMPAAVTSDWDVIGPIRLFHMYVPLSAFDRAVAEGLDRDPARVELRDLTYVGDPAIEGMIRAAALGLRWDEPAERLALSHVARGLVSAMAARFTNRESGLPPARGGLSPSAKRRLVEYVDTNMDAPSSIDDLSAVTGLSPFHFARAFKQSFGEGPHSYVLRRRIERAKALIEGGRLPLAEIAAACGFSSQSHFTARFRQSVGMTPGAYAAVRSA